ncbi:MAG: PKD domain-containing protein, partial [Geminicoccaceae bacterium]
IGKLYPVTLTVQDESGFPNDRHTDRIVVKVDESPIAEAGADQTVCTGVEVHFDGSKSTDFDGVVNRFTWNFGDERTGGGITPVHVYTQPGDYRVLLNIEGDQAGQCDNTDTDELVVHVVEAPVARIAGPSRVATGVAAAFYGSGSSNATGKIEGWHWDFGDGATADGAKVVHQFEKPGAYVVKLAIDTEANSSACQAVAAEHYVVANAPPVADAGSERLVGVNEDVAFDASGSSDPDGAILAYDWDFGDGASATGLYVRHRFAQSGRYPVKLTVRDDTDLPNNSATATAMITVNAAPEPVIGAPDAACPGEQLAFSAADSRDADGATLSYAWHFGDGASAEGPKVSHAFTTPGRYDLTLAVDDGTGRNNSLQQITRSFHVNRPPRALAGPDRMVCPGDPVAFDGGASVDWDGKLVDYTWDFGDGTTANGAKVVHPFETPGLYDVRLSVSDDSGSSCRTRTDVVQVQVNAPPVAVADGDRQGFTGGAYDQLLFDASASSDADGEPLSYVWDLGDGVQLAGEKILHGYAEPGEYDVKLGVSDGSGLVCGQAWTDLKVAVKRRE